MKSVTVNGQNKLRAVYQEIAKVSEGVELRLHITAVKNLVSNGLTNNAPAKLLGGLALGALLMTGTALSVGIIDADGPSRPLTSSIPSFGVADGLDELEYEEDAGLISSVDNRVAVGSLVLDEMEYEEDEGLIRSWS